MCCFRMMSLVVNLSKSTVKAPTGQISTKEIDIVFSKIEVRDVSKTGLVKKLISVFLPLPRKPSWLSTTLVSNQVTHLEHRYNGSL